MTTVLFNTDIERLPDWGCANHRYYNIGQADHGGAGPAEHELILPSGWQHIHTFQSNGYWFADLVTHRGER